MFAITRGRLVAATFGLSAAVATAQAPLVFGPVVGCAVGNCAAANHGTYGPALFAANPKGHSRLPGPDEPNCIGRSSYPLSDWHYIRQFCGPTLQPGTCYGYNPTKWRKWEETCSSAGCASGAVSQEGFAPAPLMVAPPGPIAPVTPSEQLPPPVENKPKDPPKTNGPKVDPVTPPKVPLIPKGTGLAPSQLPTVPVAPVPGPQSSEPGKINTTDAAMPPVSTSSVVPPSPEPRVVVPPTPR